MNKPDATEQSARETEDTGVPGLRTWRGIYLLVFVFFVVVVVLLASFTRYFA